MNSRRVAQGLAWFGIGLGLAELLAPRMVARAAGLRGHERLLQVSGARLRLCAAIPILVAVAVSPPACAEGLTRDSLAQTARLSGDAMIATACQLRPDSWFVVAVPAVTVELARLSRNLEPAGGLDPAHVADFIDGAMNQAIEEGTVQWTRYGQSACKAIQADGSLARLDALVTGFKRPSR